MFFILLFLIILLLGIVIYNSKLEIEIVNLDISTEREEKIKKDFKINIGIIAFNKIRILKIDAKKIKNKKINLGRVLEEAKKLEKRGNKTKLWSDLLKSLDNFKFEIKKANLNLGVGTEDAALTAILVGIIGGFLGILLKGQKFQILPIYKNQNILQLKLDCIFRVNLFHYIYKTILKGREKNETRTSNRRAYAHSNE